MKAFLRGIMIVITAIFVTACSNAQTVNVTALYLERMALPETAELQVSFSEYDPTTGTAIGEAIVNKSQVVGSTPPPFNIALDVPKKGLNKDKQYYVQASILIDGKAMFSSNEIKPVLTDANKTTAVELRLARKMQAAE